MVQAITSPSDPACAIPPNVAKIAQQRLRTSPYAALRKVHCQFHNGVLILTGEVPTFYTKQVAQEALRSLDQVQRVDNRLAVSFETEQLPRRTE